jgi:predicted DCC family thiol-disulfide oxidoreductase YuxK
MAPLAAARPAHRLVVLLDGQCPMCRRIARRLRTLDWRDRLTFVDASDAEVRQRFAPGLDEATALTAMHVLTPDGARHAGYDAFLQVARVVPFLWPVWVIGLVPVAASIGRTAYRYIAANRTRDGRCTDALCAR